MLGPTYEIISCFVQNSEELRDCASPLLRDICTGLNIGCFYFLWPIGFEDGHAYPGYVEREALMYLMRQNESAGIPTKFPHNSHLYKTFASKEWAASQCLTPGLHVPLTTKVSRVLIAQNSMMAASIAIEALKNLRVARENWIGFNPYEAKLCNIIQGVVKLGFSWEAMDVIKWTNQKELAKALESLIEQPGSLNDFCFVQEWVDFDVEWRHFIVRPDLNEPESLIPHTVVCTQFKEQTERGGFTDFTKFGLEASLHNNFHHDHIAFNDAILKSRELIRRWCYWLQAESAELPTVVRFDILVKKHPQGGSAIVHMGELTELGGCFLGWHQGPAVIQAAMIESVVYPMAMKMARRIEFQQQKGDNAGKMPPPPFVQAAENTVQAHLDYIQEQYNIQLERRKQYQDYAQQYWQTTGSELPTE